MRFQIGEGTAIEQPPVPMRLMNYPEGLSVQAQADGYWTTILKFTPHGEVHRVAKAPEVMRLLHRAGFRFDRYRRIVLTGQAL